ncbi:HTH-type transcriptional regulator GbpR [Pigmentiphaga humi]|uniref:HTH-type transcriptional regulator GbpR n=1 Tax=Pigmentiphaga humi TaxID=2478468 RepID=A0A3P4B6D7_9BURK|nr:LysR substrate-binding domain-containing protein [Pigmentiphaga humi]VCU71160.1 HTH-type transcriptional regulator GbpR [Pigmentiphaga humi]
MSNFRLTPNALGHKLKLHQLQVFERVLERRSLSRAANELNLTQPSVTKAIYELEKFVGAPLFERSNRGVVPTELAHLLGRRVKTLMAELRYMTDELNAALTGESGHVIVGTLIAASAKLLPEAISLLMRDHPGIRVTISEGPSSQLFPALATGDLDIVVGRLPERDIALSYALPLTHHTLYEEPLLAVVGAHHPLAREEQLDLPRLMDQLWILPSAESPLRTAVEQTFHRSSLGLPARHIESLSLLTNLGILLRGEAIALMPQDAAQQFLDHGLLARLPLAEFGLFGRVGYSVRSNRTPTPASQHLVDYLHAVAAGRTAPP